VSVKKANLMVLQPTATPKPHVRVWRISIVVLRAASQGQSWGQVPSHVDGGQASAEREGERLYAGIKKFDLELAVDYCLRLSDQLTGPKFTGRRHRRLNLAPGVASAERDGAE
jgi:hypothetical protein